MNNNLKRVNEESILFFDIETASNSSELVPDSREYGLFKRKMDKANELTEAETISLYNEKAPLTMCYTRIVSIGVGFIKNGELYIKAIEGEEENVIKEFCTIANSFDYLCGLNIKGFDAPMIYNNGFRYFDMTTMLNSRFITSGVKPWDLDKSYIDLMEIFKGTHYMNSSLDEICYHFGVESPKSELDGSMVSHEFWNNGAERISQYVKQDVLASASIFRRMRWEKPFTYFIDRSSVKQKEPTILEKLNATKNISTKDIETLKGILSKKRISKKNKDIVVDLIQAALIDVDPNFGKINNQDYIEDVINDIREEIFKK